MQQPFPSRSLGALCVLFSMILWSVAGSGQAWAEAPARKMVQVPGYYRMALGDFEVTALFDGVVKLDSKLLKGVKSQDLSRLFAALFVDASGGVQTAVNAYLVNTGANLILVDTGSGKALGPTMGFLAENLRAAGYEPSQVDTVLLTHLHPDHVLGLVTQEGQAAFPNARVLASAPEAAYWLSEQEEAKAPEMKKRGFKAARSALAPYQAAGRFVAFEKGDPLPAGVEAVFTAGHTPGHCGYLFASKGEKLLALGDIVHSHAVQFARPEVAIEFDSDQRQAVATRKRVFADAAREKYWLAGAHLPFPGIGHVRAQGKAYAWVPAEFGPVAAGPMAASPEQSGK